MKLRPRPAWTLPLFFALVLAHAQQPSIQSELQRAAEHLRTGDIKSAAEEFKQVLAEDSKNVTALANLGVIAYSRNDFPQAAQYLSEALALDPTLVKVQALLGICEHRMGDPSAERSLERSFPHLNDKKLKIQAGLELANLYRQNGDLERDANVMQSLVDTDPDNVDILFMTQQIHAELADETLNKLAILAPHSARMQQVIAERLINEGALAPAREHYRKALELDPVLPGVRLELAEAILQSSPSDASAQAEAERQVQLAQKTEGDSAKAECVLAGLALRRSDATDASAHLSRALALNPQSVEAQVGVARMLMSADKPEEALRHLQTAVKVDPLNSEAHYRLAAVYKKLGNSEAAHKEAKLFEEIKQTKSEIRELYRQMNKQAPQDMQEFAIAADNKTAAKGVPAHAAGQR